MSFLKRIKALGDNVAHQASIRKTRVAADLALLITKSGKKQTEVAAALNITDAALSMRLSGKANLALDSIGSICDVLDADFDIVFRSKSQRRTAKNFWETSASKVGETSVIFAPIPEPKPRLHGGGYERQMHSQLYLCANDPQVRTSRYG